MGSKIEYKVVMLSLRATYNQRVYMNILNLLENGSNNIPIKNCTLSVIYIQRQS